jgi:hypothetical protein
VIHTCGLDKEIISYDLKKEKKVKQHAVKNGIIYDMAQEKLNELELGKFWAIYSLVTCGFNNPISFWDIDVTEPTAAIPLSERALTIGMSTNGKRFAVATEKNEVRGLENANFRYLYLTQFQSSSLKKFPGTVLRFYDSDGLVVIGWSPVLQMDQSAFGISKF